MRDLTKREVEVADLITQGYTDKEIAQRLQVSHGTVKAHSQNLFHKLRIHRRIDVGSAVRERNSEVQQGEVSIEAASFTGGNPCS